MSEEDVGTPTVGVVGGNRVSDVVSAAGAGAVDGDAASVLAAEPSAVVAAGERALVALARREPSVPVLPVAAGRGVRSVPREALEPAVDRLVEGDWWTDRHPLVGVETEGESTLAVFDAMLVTAQPADISEFTVTAGGERVARFRADGVVTATSAGSSGYSRAADGPVLTPGMDALAVVPVAPFATTLDHWVVPLDAVTVTVERDGATVEVLADDRSVGSATAGRPVRFRHAGWFDLVCVPEGVSPFDPQDAELEKH